MYLSYLQFWSSTNGLKTQILRKCEITGKEIGFEHTRGGKFNGWIKKHVLKVAIIKFVLTISIDQVKVTKISSYHHYIMITKLTNPVDLHLQLLQIQVLLIILDCRTNFRTVLLGSIFFVLNIFNILIKSKWDHRVHKMPNSTDDTYNYRDKQKLKVLCFRNFYCGTVAYNLIRIWHIYSIF